MNGTDYEVLYISQGSTSKHTFEASASGNPSMAATVSGQIIIHGECTTPEEASRCAQIAGNLISKIARSLDGLALGIGRESQETPVA